MISPCAIAVSATILKAVRGDLDEKSLDWLQRGVWLYAPLGIGLGMLLLAAPWFVPILKLRPAFFGMGADHSRQYANVGTETHDSAALRTPCRLQRSARGVLPHRKGRSF
jgi:hypothetical protein